MEIMIESLGHHRSAIPYYVAGECSEMFLNIMFLFLLNSEVTLSKNYLNGGFWSAPMANKAQLNPMLYKQSKVLFW